MSQITAFLLVVIAALGGFYGGFRYEKGAGTANAASNSAVPRAASTTAPNSSGSGQTRGGGAFSGAGGFVGVGGAGGAGRGGSAGTISNLSDKGFTLTVAGGGTVTVTYGSSAPTVRKTAEGSLADLQNGETVTVTGSRDSSNNLTPQQITIVPAATPAG